MLHQIRMLLKQLAILLLGLFHLPVFADGEFFSSINGVWQRVYDECSDEPVANRGEILGLSKDVTPLRELTLLIEDDHYEVYVAPSLACQDSRRKTHSPADCRAGVNIGEVLIDASSSRLSMRARERTDLLHLWGGIIDFFDYQMIDDKVLVLQTSASFCGRKRWTIYFIPFTTS